MSHEQPYEDTPSHTEDPDEAYENYRETEEYERRNDPKPVEPPPYTIDHSKDRFETYQQAVLAAASKVMELKQSIAIYNRGTCVDLRRF